MKTKFLSLFLVAFTLKVAGQSTQCDLLKKASISFCNNDYNNAIQNLLEFRRKFQNHTLIEEVNQQIGHMYFLNLEFEKSKIELTTLIKRKAKEKNNNEQEVLECSTNYDSSNFECMRIVFPEPYIHLQHFACLDLFEIYKKENKLEKSLQYLKLADKKYIYNMYCGNGNDMIDIAMALRYKEIYLLKADTTSAIKELAKVIFTIGENHAEIVKSLKVLLDLKYTPNQRRSEIDYALNSIKKVEMFIDEKNYNWFEMNLFGQTIHIPGSISEYGKIETVDKIKDKIKGFKFFMDLEN